MTFMSLDPRTTALFLDVDRTLLEIVDNPASVVADAVLIDALHRFTDRHPVFPGDDVTDEDGFAVVNELGGTSVHVDNNNGTLALQSLPDVGAARRWLVNSFVEPNSA